MATTVYLVMDESFRIFLNISKIIHDEPHTDVVNGYPYVYIYE